MGLPMKDVKFHRAHYSLFVAIIIMGGQFKFHTSIWM